MSAAIEYDGRAVCALEVADLESSLGWYQQALEFEVVHRLESWGWAELSTPLPGISIGLGQVEKPQTEGGVVVTFGVRDIDAARRHLESLGTRFDGETRMVGDEVRLATFYDPDGNTFMLSQRLEAR
ncbi:putative enzyme related to lactoylglutathione lyase [Kribbella steppae]|uniref:Putative enzyme related to lactoylglutathione lyase n=1 Tax=Kribbella steppae TaxID=2512223 RepID=A0A4R2HHW0_9ACTN|nr:VOC family protein [Kribbella steppae]TCO26533.1 putative enzyme related to lactoylglutathione lyase [Kribbella steppae]